MDEYELVKKSGLKFKGEKKKKKRNVKDEAKVEENVLKSNFENKDAFLDAEEHGGWWAVEEVAKIRDEVCLEFLPGCYARALNNGKIVLGDPHPPGEEPNEEEIFMGMPASSGKVAFKSGFARYLGVDKQGRIVGLSLAIGEQESFSLVSESNCGLALKAHNGNFLAPDGGTEERQLVARSSTIRNLEKVTIRIPDEP